MEKINFIIGDATNPIGIGNKLIVHICNDVGVWGGGFVLALSKKWIAPEVAYREWFKSGNNFGLGKVQFVQVETNTWVANMIGQRDVRRGDYDIPPVRYDAIKEGLSKVSEYAKQIKATIHMPRIGCGLAGGKWDQVELLVREEICAADIQSFVYDLK